MVSVLTQIFLLAAALSADIFAVGFTYGAGGIRLSPAAAFLLTGIPAVILTLSMGLGGAAGSYFPGIAGRMFGAVILTGLGVWSLLDRSDHEEVAKADKNQDRFVTCPEALTLSVALSLDSLAGGVGAGREEVFYLATAFLFGIVTGLTALLLGEYAGKCVSGRLPFRPSQVGGGLLLVLAVLKLLC